MVVLVVSLISLERWARRKQHYTVSAQRPRGLARQPLKGLARWVALCVCLLPILLGFLLPATYLSAEAWKRFQFAGLSDRLLTEA